MTLRLASDFELPDSAVTETFAIVGKRGMGKTNTGVVLAEELIAAGACVVVLDPLSVWWGLRHAGRGAGLPVLILGGPHADAPLEPSSGRFVAEILVATRKSMVLDLGDFSKTGQRTFVADFAEELYRRNRDPLHVILDEADTFAPQRTGPGEERMLGAVDALWRRARSRGIGGTLITQRPAVVSKNLLTQSEVLVTHRLVAPQDQDAIADWVKSNATDREKAKLMLGQLDSLPVGEAWFWSPGWLDAWRRVQVRHRGTFDSSATPKPGSKAAAPGRAADVDLDAFRARMAELAETAAPPAKGKAAADDRTAALRARVAELEQQLATRMPSLTEDEDRLLKKIDNDLLGAKEALDRAWSGMTSVVELLAKKVDIRPPVALPPRKPTGPREPLLVDAPTVIERVATERRAERSNPGDGLGRAERALLAVLAQRPTTTAQQLSILSGYSVRSSSFANALSALRTAGLIDGSRDALKATAEGRKRAGKVEPLPSGTALLEYWGGKLGKAERAMLECVVRGRSPVSKEHISRATGYSLTSSSFANALSKLRTLELVSGRDPIQAAPIFFERGGARG